MHSNSVCPGIQFLPGVDGTIEIYLLGPENDTTMAPNATRIVSSSWFVNLRLATGFVCTGQRGIFSSTFRERATESRLEKVIAAGDLLPGRLRWALSTTMDS